MQAEKEKAGFNLKAFVEEIAKGTDPDLGLQYVIDFVKAIRAKASFFRIATKSIFYFLILSSRPAPVLGLGTKMIVFFLSD